MKRLDGMEWSLFPAFFVWLVCSEKAGAGEMEFGALHRVNGRKGTTLAVGSNPAYELSERCERPVPVRDEPV